MKTHVPLELLTPSEDKDLKTKEAAKQHWETFHLCFVPFSSLCFTVNRRGVCYALDWLTLIQQTLKHDMKSWAAGARTLRMEMPGWLTPVSSWLSPSYEPHLKQNECFLKVTQASYRVALSHKHADTHAHTYRPRSKQGMPQIIHLWSLTVIMACHKFESAFCWYTWYWSVIHHH